jgi:energy-coupling factor transporter ATP-binding protein EcfA2
MTRKPVARPSDLLADPFGERGPLQRLPPMDLLGARFSFESRSTEMLGLATLAFGALPPHRLSARIPRLTVALLVQPANPKTRRTSLEPAPLHMQSGAGYLIGATHSSNFVCLSPAGRMGVVAIAPPMLRFPYHTRYESIEFAVFTLAARCQGLISLHAACVSLKGRAILLMGPSGAGKSTVTLHCLLHGFDMVSEDSVFVDPRTMRATGLANFLHVTAESLRWVMRARDVAAIRKSPVIRRRSGVKKFEVDLRRGPYRLAPSPPSVAAVVFLSPEAAVGGALLTPLSTSDRLAQCIDAQAYAASLPTWPLFERNLAKIDAFVLRRGAHPRDSVEALAAILESTRNSARQRSPTTRLKVCR